MISHECRKVLDNNRTYPWFFGDTDKLQQIGCFWFLIRNHSFVCSASLLIFQHIPFHISCILNVDNICWFTSQIIVASGVIRLFCKSYVLGYHTLRWWNAVYCRCNHYGCSINKTLPRRESTRCSNYGRLKYRKDNLRRINSFWHFTQSKYTLPPFLYKFTSVFVFNQNNSWMPHCVESFNMDWQDISKVYPLLLISTNPC